MPAATITPAIGALSTTEADLANTTVATSEEWIVDIRLTNVSAAAVTARIAVSDGTNIRYLCYDWALSIGESIDVAKGLILPANWRIRGRAGAATSIDYVITGAKRNIL